jgi:hypothetical protein
MLQTISGRIPPALPAHQMVTYRVTAPLSTHYRVMTCAEWECDAHLRGWETVADEGTDLGRRQAAYIRGASGRRFAEDRDEAGLTRFTFAPGQRCFEEHRGRNSRPERYLVVGGDWRGNPTGERREHKNPDLWVEDFAGHQERLRRQVGA